MVMRWEPEVQIEDLRNHPAELVMRLRTLLTRGAHTNPDPNHPGFYEIESDNRVYYVHISPNTGKILLLATWPSENVLEAAHHAA
ncbi:MAG: PepSY domain-containing protein [Candidatus Acidiferrales bacterium]